MSTQRLNAVPGGVPALGVTGWVQPADIDFSASNTAKGLITAGNISQIMANGAVGANQLANGAIGPNAVAANLIQMASGSLTAAQIANLGTGITIANAVANQSYHVFAFSVGLTIAANNVAFANGAAVVLQCNSTNVTAGNIPAAVFTGNATTPGTHVAAAGAQTLVANTALVLKTQNGATFDTGSNATAPWNLWYALV